MANRLAGSSSPYLLQHADNPVDWWEWSDDAFDEARRRDLPVLLSVGYAACHWCHVMAHESFEDDEVAAAVNAGFVAVKVDREERPDVDAVYMAAVTALTGHGGWPMTCLLTPGRRPVLRGHLPAQGAAARAAGQRRRGVGRAARPGAGLRGERRGAAARAHRPAGTVAAGRRRSATPPCAGCARRTTRPAAGSVERPSSRRRWCSSSCCATTPAPARPTRSRWPAAPARRWPAAGCTTSSAAASPGTPSTPTGWCRTSRRCSTTTPCCCGCTPTCGARPATPSPAGSPRRPPSSCCATCAPTRAAFASALDADTVVDGHSHEGLTYAWTPGAARRGARPGRRRACGARCSGSRQPAPSRRGPRRCSCAPTPTTRRGGRRRASGCWRRAATRPQPSRDDKVVTAWNGLAVAALADAGVLLGRPDLVDAAATAAAFVLDVHLVDGMLRRTSRGGPVGTAPGVLDDHGDLAEGLLALHQATGDAPVGGRRRGAARRGRSSGSSTSTASCTTPRTTHRRCSRGRRGAPTTPSRRGPRRSPAPWSRTPPSPGRRGTATRRRRPRTPAARWPSRTRASPGGRSPWPRRSSRPAAGGGGRRGCRGVGARRGGPGEHVTGAGRGAGRAGCRGGAVARGASARGRPARGLRLPRVRLRRTGHDS